MPEDERYEGDDLEVLARAEEAEEAAFGEEEVGAYAAACATAAAHATVRKQQLALWQPPEGCIVAALVEHLRMCPLTVAACCAVM